MSLSRAPISAIVLAAILSSAMGTLASADSTYSGPALSDQGGSNQDLFNQYCGKQGGGDAQANNPADLPGPKYANPDVASAAQILSSVADTSYYFYGGIASAYAVGKKTTLTIPSDAPVGTSQNAHRFLVILCGEFRDRATLIRDKINWIKNLYLLPDAQQSDIDLPNTPNIWSKFTAQAYPAFLQLSSALYSAREEANGGKTFSFNQDLEGNNLVATAPIEAHLVCKVRYMISQYVAKGKAFDSLDAFNAGYQTFQQTPGFCSESDLHSYYDFRGDSNFKPNSPESNGMIWRSSSVAAKCKSPTTGTDGNFSQECSDYFTAPFAGRWTGARAGLGVLTLHTEDKVINHVIADTQQMLTINEHNEGQIRPYGYTAIQTDTGTFPAATITDQIDPNWTVIPGGWSLSDMGFNQFVGFAGGGQAHPEMAYARLRDSVNRHTDWYHFGYNNGHDAPKTQAYSPFVASSYEPSKSDQFTFCGITVPCGTDGGDGKKQWMFVFRIKEANWYNTQSISDGRAVNFDSDWFDETSLGTVGLAKSERAWDRLGSPLEGELDSILYLHNIASGQ